MHSLRIAYLPLRRAGLLVVPLLIANAAPGSAQLEPAPAVSGSITFTQPLMHDAPGDLAQRIVVEPSARAVAPWLAVGFRWRWDAIAEGDATRPTGGVGLRFLHKSLRISVGVNMDAAYDRLEIDHSGPSASPPGSEPQWPPHMPGLADSIPGKWWGELPDPIELTPNDIFRSPQSVGAGGAARYTMRPVTDLTGMADWAVGPLAVGVQAGWRLAGPANRQLWYGISAAAPLVPTLALVAGMDRRHDRLLAPSPTRMTLGLQWRATLLGHRRPAGSRPTSNGPDASMAVPGRVRSLTVDRLPDGIRLRAVISGAGEVEVRGDLTGWRGVSMKHAPDGTWQLDLTGGPGVHQLAMRVDGGAWLPPPGLPVGSDGYGGAIGLLVVEP